MTEQELFDYLQANLSIALADGSCSYENDRAYIGFSVKLNLYNPASKMSETISSDYISFNSY